MIAPNDHRGIVIRRDVIEKFKSRRALGGRLPLSDLIQLLEGEISGAVSYHRTSARKHQKFPFLRLGVCVIYPAIECPVKWALNRTDEIHGFYRNRGNPENDGSTNDSREPPEARAKRARKAREVFLKDMFPGSPSQRLQRRLTLPLPSPLPKYNIAGAKSPVTKGQSSSNLYRLPYELREMIWLFAVSNRDPIHLHRVPYRPEQLRQNLGKQLFLTDGVSGDFCTGRIFEQAGAGGFYLIPLLLSCRRV